MTKQPFRPGVGVHLILIADEHILLGQRMSTGFADGCWSVPGGHLDAGETLPAGAIREAHEELVITIDPTDLTFTHLCHHQDPDGQARIGAFFTATHWTGEPVNAEPHKCAKLAWYRLDDLPENTVDYARNAINHHQQGTTFSLHGW